ncbi:type II secretion system F family protein [Cellulomonas sp. URHD0024]|uniref:type II secretion system F family protein n=1 Tax=Cellulomonas sp. URHD0024 TaxID=1302620 RepID=UPI0003FEC056|nr:type II secretion system F family protein [Cellulomonas sp. URHD0024]
MSGLVVVLAVLGATSPWWSRGPVPRSPALPAAVVTPTASDPVLLLDLVEVALSTGASLPRALAAVGSAARGAAGEHLSRASASLLLGASWASAWAGSAAGLSDVAEVLEASWTTGSAPGPALRARADELRRRRRARARAAAGALGVRLVLPLGLCFLPAFVLLGLVPMVLSLAAGLFGG